LACAKHVAQSNSRSVNRHRSAQALLPKKATRCKAGGFFVVHQTGVRARFLATSLYQQLRGQSTSSGSEHFLWQWLQCNTRKPSISNDTGLQGGATWSMFSPARLAMEYQPTLFSSYFHKSGSDPEFDWDVL
jgi:hypothetical protein